LCPQRNHGNIQSGGLVLKFIVFTTIFATLGFQASAQELVKPASTFGQRGLGYNQATGFTSRNGFRPDANYEPMLRYVASQRLGMLVNYVGYLDVKTSGETSNKCTATLIAADKILTNAHCVQTQGSKRATNIEFTLGYLQTFDRSSERTFVANPKPLERNETLDYAILALQEPVPDYTDPHFSFRDPKAGEPLLLVGHPLAQPLHITQAGCTVFSGRPMRGNTVFHVCDSEQGHSGSLLFSADDPHQIIGLHHQGGSDANQGIRITSLWNNSDILRETFKEDGTTPAISTSTVQGIHSISTPSTQVAWETGELQLGLKPAAKKELQGRLLSLGYDVGQADGVFGPKTRIAIKKWQQENGFGITGYFDKVQLEKLQDMSEVKYQKWIADLPRKPKRPAISHTQPPASPSRSRCFTFEGVAQC